VIGWLANGHPGSHVNVVPLRNGASSCRSAKPKEVRIFFHGEKCVCFQFSILVSARAADVSRWGRGLRVFAGACSTNPLSASH